MKVRYVSGAWRDYEEALMWHQRQNTGRGFDLSEEIEAAIERICSDPTSWEAIERNCRRIPVRRFPYSIIFRVRPSNQGILIVAVMHASRDPDYWKSRVSDE